ncbi:MAG: hypothetical protein ACR2OU_21825 [Thermomicrobiales bacterium]
MFNRDNAIGLILLGVCAAVAAYMIYTITTGNKFAFQINETVGWVLGIAFFGLVIYGMFTSGTFRRFGRGGQQRQWPDPNTGRRTWWDRMRGR